MDLALILQAADFAAAADESLDSLFESFTEVSVEVGIDDGIQRRVEIADPEQNLNNDFRAIAGVAAHADRDIPEEEGQPAKDECSHNDSKCFGRFVFPLHLADSALGWGRLPTFRVIVVRIAVVRWRLYVLSERMIRAVPGIVVTGNNLIPAHESLDERPLRRSYSRSRA
ncbi:hypothetical protein CEXT_318741 [Caerostris extrusa]|uniref:Uncharacterized protein n=1 Tax=Caerostris extrusa TaxID=172846 RepID=A0AAV4QKF5_CAEEX|nr:hypothetical protein CEXT_318741 [Caerostris extrusa]